MLKIKKILASTLLCAVLASGSIMNINAAPYPEIHKVGEGTTVIEGEDFDAGDDGDFEELNASSGNRPYRPGDEMPQQEGCSNGKRASTPNPNYNTCYIAADEYLTFTVDVEKDGNYTLSAWLAASSDLGSEAQFYVDGEKKGKVISPSQADGAGWQEWYLEVGPAVNLTAGTHKIKLFFIDGDINLDAIEIVNNGGFAEEETTTEAPTTTVAEEITAVDEGVTPPADGEETTAVDTTTTAASSDSSSNSNVMWIVIAGVALVVIIVIVVVVMKKGKK